MITFLIIFEAICSFLAGYYYHAIEAKLKEKEKEKNND